MTRMVQVDVDGLYQRHEQLLQIEVQLADLLREGGSPERELGEVLHELAERILEQLEDILDSDQSQAVMEDVTLHGAVPWEEVEADLEC